MPTGQHLTRYQQGIVKRYYEHGDTLALQKVAELVSELYLCSEPAKKAKLWKQAETALKKLPIEPAKQAAAVASQDPKKLAELVALCSPGGRKG